MLLKKLISYYSKVKTNGSTFVGDFKSPSILVALSTVTVTLDPLEDPLISLTASLLFSILFP